MAGIPAASALIAIFGGDAAGAERPLNRLHGRSERRAQRRHAHHRHHGGKGKHDRKHGQGAGETCLEGHDLCGVLIAKPCCKPAVCTPANSVIVSSCRQPCDSDRDCIGSPFGGSCVQDLDYCPFLPGGRCCE